MSRLARFVLTDRINFFKPAKHSCKMKKESPIISTTDLSPKFCHNFYRHRIECLDAFLSVFNKYNLSTC